MKKSNLLLILFVFCLVTAKAQQTCEQKVEKAAKVLTSKSPFKNFTTLFKQLKPCADGGNVKAQHYIGLLYIEGLGTPKNESLGFQYIQKAAIAGFAMAQGNLGTLYKYGTGCKVSPVSAVEWFKKGATNGNSKAAYSLGYMYYKGLGIDQDYNQAVKWFKLSEDPMAKHWLGVCSYFGYGTSQNTAQAVAYLTGNNTPNSKAFMKHIKADKKEILENEVVQAVTASAQAAQKIETKVLEHAAELIDHNQLLENKDLVGEWTGKLIEYDESGKRLQRVLPIDINFTADEFGDIKTNIQFNEQTFENYVLFEDNNLFIDHFNFSLKKQYTHNPKQLSLDYQVLGMDVSKKTVHNITYLLADVDVYIPIWEETAPPMSLVLRPKNNTIISKEEEQILLALATQKEEFIKLYPVPFRDQVHIAFNLEKQETVQVKITGINNAQTIVVEPGKIMEKGQQTYHANTNDLPNGLYVIKVITSVQVYTRIVIKE